MDDRGGAGGCEFPGGGGSGVSVIEGAKPTTAELEIYRAVDFQIGIEARRLCAEACGDAKDGKPCRGCSAASHHEWRRDAKAALRIAAELANAQAAEVAA